jgi:hypothetical protein
VNRKKLIALLSRGGGASLIGYQIDNTRRIARKWVVGDCFKIKISTIDEDQRRGCDIQLLNIIKKVSKK